MTDGWRESACNWNAPNTQSTVFRGHKGRGTIKPPLGLPSGAPLALCAIESPLFVSPAEAKCSLIPNCAPRCPRSLPLLSNKFSSDTRPFRSIAGPLSRSCLSVPLWKSTSERWKHLLDYRMFASSFEVKLSRLIFELDRRFLY